MLIDVAFVWALVLLGMSATVRFRWSVYYALASVGILWIAIIGILSFYEGKQGENGFVIEGPEFFGAAFLLFGGTIFAVVVLIIGGVIALIRKHLPGRPNGSEQF